MPGTGRRKAARLSVLQGGPGAPGRISLEHFPCGIPKGLDKFGGLCTFS